jgi:hypothetical protein
MISKRTVSISLTALCGVAILGLLGVTYAASKNNGTHKGARLLWVDGAWPNAQGVTAAVTAPKTIATHPNILQSNDPQLKQLGTYEEKIGKGFSTRMMVFTEIPATPAIAQDQADDMAQAIAEYARYGVSPLVVFEPTVNKGQYFDLAQITKGTYDAGITAYFQALKDKHITDAQMGTWILFPEPNIPEWGVKGQTGADMFAQNYTHVAKLLKAVFPAAKTSVMLNSQTYAPGDTDWANPSYSSLVPFVKDIPDNLVDSFGLQGFPWSPPADEKGDRNFKAADFLNAQLAIDAAKQLNVKTIWFNTGTFHSVYSLQAAKKVTVSAADRQAILNDILTQAKKAQAAGFVVWINIFAEDKSQNTSEATDWSYLATADTTQILKSFIDTSLQNGMEVSVFDSK